MPWDEPRGDGPTLQPMRRGLPHTPIENCRELMLAIVAQGLADDDAGYVCSPTFIHHCCYLGMDPDAALSIKIRYLRREIDLKRLTMTRLHAERFDAKDPRAGYEAHWDTWGKSASR